MKTLISAIQQRCHFLGSKWFAGLSWIAAIGAPLPLTIQLYKVSTAPSVEGVAAEAYLLLAILHFILMWRGIKNLDNRIVTTFFLTSTVSTLITIVVLARGGEFMFFD